MSKNKNMEKIKKPQLIIIMIAATFSIAVFMYFAFQMYSKYQLEKEFEEMNVEVVNSERQYPNSVKKVQTPEIVKENLKDNNAYKQAINEVDVKYCENIDDKSIQKKCITSVSDLQLYQEAFDSKNIEFCTQIQSESKRIACVSVIKN